jgi:hypothetical protein
LHDEKEIFCAFSGPFRQLLGLGRSFLGDRNVLKKLLVIALLLTPVFASAQVAPATSGGGPDIWVGAEYSNFKPDYGFNRLSGIAVYGDVNRIVLRNLGIEGEARWLHFNQYQGETEANYLAGPRYRLWR